MIHYYCDGSYKKISKIVACGIVRVDGEVTSSVFQYTTSSNWFDKQEEFALHRTLRLIEKNEDKNVTIWNDSLFVIRNIREKSKSKLWQKRVEIVNQKLSQLRKKGYQIKIKVRSEKESPYMKEAHDVSRTYLDDENIKQIIKQERNKKETAKTGFQKKRTVATVC